MSLIEATIRVHCDCKNWLIDVEYGAGRKRVPLDCLYISELTKPYFSHGTIAKVQQRLYNRMPDIVFRVIYGVGLPFNSYIPPSEEKSNLIR
jgi:hypothetical protein